MIKCPDILRKKVVASSLFVLATNEAATGTAGSNPRSLLTGPAAAEEEEEEAVVVTTPTLEQATTSAVIHTKTFIRTFIISNLSLQKSVIKDFDVFCIAF
mmetsp:Transcript_29106/g.32699  ORF Transcript_29106/g.32699 Transcript_29106/m.32699 type:complete len:100 (+) Transcript_29106:1172-1471(+)